MDNGRLWTFLVCWVLAMITLGTRRSSRGMSVTGLVLAYVLNLWMIHWLAPALYLLPWYQGYDPLTVQAGLEQSTYGVIAFVFGSLLLTPFLFSLGLPRTRAALTLDRRLPRAYLAVGAVFYALLSFGVGAIPSATSIVSTGQQLVVVGLALCCWYAWRVGSKSQLIFWLGLTLLMPLVTIVTRGFIGYGAVATLIVLVFVSGFVKARPMVFAAGLLLGYIGLSVYVTYMRDRGDIRDTVWGGQPMQVRLAQLEQSARNFEWFDISNVAHLQRVDGRLNQSFLVGLAVERLADGGDYAKGQTLWEALTALVPRAIWPEKTVQAGGGNLVSEYTGLTFAEGTSVGIGQVMEFYVNFGTVGVILGFMLMGVLVTTLDRAAAERLTSHDLHGFVLWYLPGISLLQVGGSLVEVSVSAVAGSVVAVVVNKYLDRPRQKQDHRLQRLSPVPRPHS
jgi:hypothetical protein